MKKVLVFSAKYCNPCEAYKKSLEMAEADFKSAAAEIQYIDTELDTSSELMRKYLVKSIPTTIILQDDEILASFSGAVPVAAVLNIVTGGDNA